MMQPDQTVEERATIFRALHTAPDIFILPNAWDVTSALVLEQAGFAAIATTSAGVGYSFGYPIGQNMPRAGIVRLTPIRLKLRFTAAHETRRNW